MINDEMSVICPVKFGVPQGGTLSSLLFILFINDIFNLQLKGRIQLNADDAVIEYDERDYEHLMSDMQADLEILLQWFNLNGLTLN